MEIQFAERIAHITGEDKAIITCSDYLCKGESDVETFSAETQMQHRINDAVVVELKKGNEDIKKQASQSVSVTQEMVHDCKYLLSLMGIPFIDSPTEAEAQCAMLVKLGKAYAVASEDMDSLAFGAPVLLRGFGNRKEPITEINYMEVLECLEMNHMEFVDLCIL